MKLIKKIFGGNKNLSEKENVKKEILSYLHDESFQGARGINPEINSNSYKVFVENLAPHVSEGLKGISQEEITKIIDKISFISSYDEDTCNEILGATLLLTTIVVTLRFTQGVESSNSDILKILQEIVNNLSLIHKKYYK